MTSNNPRLSPEKGPRYFSACDAARIARNVVDDRKTTPESVLACIAKGLGFTHISLSRENRVQESGVNISKGTVSVVINLLKRVIGLTKTRLPSIAKLLGPILDFLVNLADLIDRLLEQPAQERVEDVIRPGECNCKDQPNKGETNGKNDN